LGGAFGLINRPFDVGRISGEATPSDKNDELASNNPTYRVYVVEWLESAKNSHSGITRFCPKVSLVERRKEAISGR